MTRIFASIKAALAGAAILFAAVAVYFIRKSGGDAERAKQAAAEMRSANTVAEKRAAARAASDENHQKGIDKWTRKP